MAILIHTNGQAEWVSPREGADFHLEELQEMVGGYFEFLHPPFMPGLMLVVNEAGRNLHLPDNDYATLLTGRYFGTILGEALLCKTGEVQ